MADRPAVQVRPLLRGQLAKFLPDHESIKAFESLVGDVREVLPDAVQLAATVADDAQQAGHAGKALAHAAMAEIARLWTALANVSSGVWASATVDFGATPVSEGTFTVTDAGVSATSVIECTVRPTDTTATNDAGSHLMAGILFRMVPTPGAGAFSLDIKAMVGLVTGQFVIRYKVSA